MGSRTEGRVGDYTDDTAGYLIDADVVDPLSEVCGALILDEVYDTVTRYVVFANDFQAVAVVLWVGATHARAAWHHATRLVITSPQKRCGKSRLMDIVAGLCHSPLLSANTTTPAIFRSIGDDDSDVPTLFFDETDALFGTKRAAEEHEDLRALINAGWQRGRPVRRCVGPQHAPTDFNTYAMAALAAIGELPDTIVDRAINIELKRRRLDEQVAPFRVRRDSAALTELRDRLHPWVRHPDRLKRLQEAEPDMPPGVQDRAADAWEPLLAMADEAGGDWPARARAACKALSERAAVNEAEPEIQLLSDIRQIFSATNKQFIASSELEEELCAIEESPWHDLPLTTNKLAHRLKAFGVKPRPNAKGDQRGYRREAFDDVFTRYLPRDPSECQTTECERDQRRDGADSRGLSGMSAGVGSDAFRRPADASDENDNSAKPAAQTGCSDGLTPSDRTHARKAATLWASNTVQNPPPPGGLTPSSPGQTDRVQRALALARAAYLE